MEYKQMNHLKNQIREILIERCTLEEIESLYKLFWKNIKGSFRNEILEFNELFKEVAYEKNYNPSAFRDWYNDTEDAKSYGKI